MTWDQYNSLMIELFSTNPLPKVAESQWKMFVNEMAKLPYFLKSGIPMSSAYSEWQDWAKAMMGILNVTRR
jgi:hypothetical protein